MHRLPFGSGHPHARGMVRRSGRGLKCAVLTSLSARPALPRNATWAVPTNQVAPLGVPAPVVALRTSPNKNLLLDGVALWRMFAGGGGLCGVAGGDESFYDYDLLPPALSAFHHAFRIDTQPVSSPLFHVSLLTQTRTSRLGQQPERRGGGCGHQQAVPVLVDDVAARLRVPPQADEPHQELDGHLRDRAHGRQQLLGVAPRLRDGAQTLFFPPFLPRNRAFSHLICVGHVI